MELERGQLFQDFVEQGRSDLLLLFFWVGRTFSVKIPLSHSYTRVGNEKDLTRVVLYRRIRALLDIVIVGK